MNQFEIVPDKKHRVIDLASEAGIDTSAWRNYRGKNPAANPKYCYEWALVEPDKVVLLNLWYEDIERHDGAWSFQFSPREWGRYPDGRALKPIWIKRADALETAIATAYHNGLPLRVVVCSGQRRQTKALDLNASKISKRVLDPVSWAVTSYDRKNGQCTLVRGSTPDIYVDQFSTQEQSPPERLKGSSYHFSRSSDVRRQVRLRAKGRCEYCSELGFRMENGSIYIETHHIVPLSEDGMDNLGNVVALCPNHHRRAHFASDRLRMREKLLALAASG